VIQEKATVLGGFFVFWSISHGGRPFGPKFLTNFPKKYLMVGKL
jgi:hypothetical protein